MNQWMKSWYNEWQSTRIQHKYIHIGKWIQSEWINESNQTNTREMNEWKLLYIFKLDMLNE